ncbi:MAG: hypothetical protein U1F43_22860 [Myxococcota bacterium]
MQPLPLALYLALRLFASPPVCEPTVAPSAWRPPAVADEVLPALFERAREALPALGECAMPVCKAHVSGYAGGFAAVRDVPDVDVRVVMDGVDARGGGDDDARSAFVALAPMPLRAGAAWQLEVDDRDLASRDRLGAWSGRLGEGAFGGTAPVDGGEASVSCRFASAADQRALVLALTRRLARGGQTLARRPGAPEPEVLERLLADLDLLAAVASPSAPDLGAARERAREALRTWAGSGRSVSVGATGVALTLEADGLDVVATLDAKARAPVTFSRAMDDREIGFDAFGTWIALDDPALAHGWANPSLMHELTVPPGERRELAFAALGPLPDGARDLVLVGAWQVGFFGSAHPFVLRH